MGKRVVSLVLLWLPFAVHGAFGAPLPPFDPGAGNVVGEDGSLNSLVAGDNIFVISGKGIRVGTGGVDLSKDLLVGLDSAPTDQGYLVIGSGIDSGQYTLNSAGNISIAGQAHIEAGRDFAIKNENGLSAIDVNIGSIDADGAFSISDNINEVVVGDVNSSDNFSILANTIEAQGLSLAGGVINISAVDSVSFADVSFKNGVDSANITVNNGSFTSGAIDNASGAISISAKTDAQINGSLSNSGQEINLAAGNNVNITGGINNSISSAIDISGASLTVGQGVSSAGDLRIDVDGNVNVTGGISLAGASNDSSFYLKASDLEVDNFNNIFISNLGHFDLILMSGALENIGNVTNGADNNLANMNLSASSVTGSTINNYGALAINATDSIDFSGVLYNHSGNTSLVSAGSLVIGGSITNEAMTTLNGNTVELSSVNNASGDLTIKTPTNTSGSISISSDVTNSGNLVIDGYGINIAGILYNQAGTTSITGATSTGVALNVGAISASGGVVNIGATSGNVYVGNIIPDTENSIVVTSDAAMNLSGAANVNLTSNKNIVVGGNVSYGTSLASGNGDFNVVSTSSVIKSENGDIEIAGGVSAVANDVNRSGSLIANDISIGESVLVQNKGSLIFGQSGSATLNIVGDLTVNNGGVVAINAEITTLKNLSVGSEDGLGLLTLSGSSITANNSINVLGGVWFNDSVGQSSGVVIKGDNYSFKTNDGAISFAGGLTIGAGKSLNLTSALFTNVSGESVVSGDLTVKAGTNVVFDNLIDNSGSVSVSGTNITATNITNTNNFTFDAGQGDIMVGNISNSGNFQFTSKNIFAGSLESSNGAVNLTSDLLTGALIDVDAGVFNISAENIDLTEYVEVAGSVYQGNNESGMLNLSGANLSLAASSLTATGDFIAESNTGSYIFDNAVSVNDIIISNGANVNMRAGSLNAGDITNSADLALTAYTGMTVGDIVNTGSLSLNTVNVFGGNNGKISAQSLTNNTGTLVVAGAGLNSVGDVVLGGSLYQNDIKAINAGDMNVRSNDYFINAANFTAKDILQETGSWVLNASNVSVTGDINATDLRITNNSLPNWMTVNVAGSVSAGTDFWGVKDMTIGGDYVFGNTSSLLAAILTPEEIGKNYWATVSLVEDKTLGQITNPDGAEALITVGGSMISNVTDLGNAIDGTALGEPQVGININSIVDQGTAIWLVHAEDGIKQGNVGYGDLALKFRNLYVNFCNATGDKCFNYLDALEAGTDEDLPVYLSERDTDGDGIIDSLYIVFDPRFGGPVEVFKIQPIVEKVENSTVGQSESANALDNMIAGQLQNTNFTNRTPIEAIPIIFRGTNLEKAAKELYDRMEAYNSDRDGLPLANFARLFQARELELIAGSIALNEHTSFREFEDRMLDEFIWNRNRNLNKVWLDFNMGMFDQDLREDKSTSGNRFSVLGGYDWQASETLIFGLTGRISNMSSGVSDVVDLTYIPGQPVYGYMNADVSNTNVGLGAYLMKILGNKTRLYGNIFADVHLLDVSKKQTFVDEIEGNGTAFSLISEWGFLHDWLNQYIVGNLYLRAGYNTGFDVTEKSAGQDYMNFESDGYMILTPGYSLTAQKRIYPSAWFQIRPYASLGIEYDVLGNPDFVKYKFAVANDYTDYAINTDALWANIGGGVEFLSATGLQIGLDYRYQYNSELQMHNVKLSTSYRF